MRLTSIVIACTVISGCGPARSHPVADPVPDHRGGVPIVFRGATIIDVSDGSRLLGHTVIVDEGRIVAIAPDEEAVVPLQSAIVDADGKFLIPGLWDMHTHSLNRYEWTLPLHVANGVTGIRDMATSMPLADVHRLRARISAGVVTGPRILTSGPLIDGPGSLHDYLEVTSPEQARTVVDSLHREGVDFIKVYELLSPETFMAVVQAASDHRLPIVGHVPVSFGDPARALDAGMRSLEHSHELRILCSSRRADLAAMVRRGEDLWAAGDTAAAKHIWDEFTEASLESYDTATCEAAGHALARGETWLTPTLTLDLRSAPPVLVPEETVFRHSAFQYMPPATLERWRARYRSAVVDTIDSGYAPIREQARHVIARVGDAHRGGAVILAGTDGSASFQVYGFNLHDELALLVDAGLTPLEALQTATVNPARFMGREHELGSITVGALADLVLLNADPLVEIDNTRAIHAVTVAGRLLRRGDLDRLLKAVVEHHAANASR